MSLSSKNPLSMLSPRRVFAATLVIVFTVEVAVMVLLPRIATATLDDRFLALLDASLLTLGTAPILWYVIILPLRRIAVTEQARAELLVQVAVEGIITVDERGVIDSINPAAARIFGYAAEELEGHEVEMLMPGSLLEQHEPALFGYRGTKPPVIVQQTVEIEGRRKDGSKVPLELSVNELRLGERRLFTGMLRDLSESKARAVQQATMVEFGQRALACSDLGDLFDEASRCIVQALDVPCSLVLELTADGRFLVLQSGVGWPDAQLGRIMIEAETGFDGRSPLEDEPLMVRDLAELEACPNARMFAEEKLTSCLCVVIHGSDRPFGVLGAFSRQRREFKTDEVHFLRDIAIEITLAVQRKQSEIEQRQRDLDRAEQMATVAQIATAVVHEIRNPLTSVKMLVQAGIEAEEAGSFGHEDLCIIENEIRRMERSLKSFLEFARPSKPERRPVDLRTLVDRNYALLDSRAVQQQVVLKQTVPNHEVVVAVDSDQMRQLLLNLTLNALDAMPGGGTLHVRIDDWRPESVRLCVSDTGPGISPPILAHLFEPFVTSKETGMGLGLVVSKRIAEDHGGTLSVETDGCSGACFTLTLPTVKTVDK